EGRVELRPELVTTNGTLLVAVEPAAAILVDPATREQYATLPGQPRRISRPPGTHSFSIQAPGYQPVLTNFLFQRNETNLVTISLPAELLLVNLSSEPPGAEFYVVKNDRVLVPLPLPARLEEGRHKLAARIPELPRLGWMTN